MVHRGWGALCPTWCGVSSLLYGGGQELRLRSQAVPAIAGFGVAAELAGQEILGKHHV